MVWYETGEDLPQPGEIVEISATDKNIKIRCLDGTILNVENSAELRKREANPSNLEDLLEINEFSDAAVAWALKICFEKDQYYVRTIFVPFFIKKIFLIKNFFQVKLGNTILISLFPPLTEKTDDEHLIQIYKRQQASAPLPPYEFFSFLTQN